MAFSSAFVNDIPAVGSGERFGDTNIIVAATTFEDELKIGRFAKIDTGSIDNMDGSATPVIAGVVLRKVSRSVEDGTTIDDDLYSQVEILRSGLTTVEAKTGASATFLQRIYVSNDGDANDGTATTDSGDVSVNAEFIRELKDNVWLINVNPPQGDVATHIGDSVGAHAASAISILDAGLFTSAIQVEAALQELYPKAPVAVADPGDGLAIPVTRSATVALTSTVGAGETRTLAIPSLAGSTLALSFDVDGGDIVITCAAGINVAGNTIMTFDTAGQIIGLVAAQVAGGLVWRVAYNDGVSLS